MPTLLKWNPSIVSVAFFRSSVELSWKPQVNKSYANKAIYSWMRKKKFGPKLRHRVPSCASRALRQFQVNGDKKRNNNKIGSHMQILWIQDLFQFSVAMSNSNIGNVLPMVFLVCVCVCAFRSFFCVIWPACFSAVINLSIWLYSMPYSCFSWIDNSIGYVKTKALYLCRSVRSFVHSFICMLLSGSVLVFVFVFLIEAASSRYASVGCLFTSLT